MGRASWPGIGRAGIRGLAAGSAGLAGKADFFTGMTAFLAAASFLLRTIFLTGFLLAAALLRAVIHFLRRPGRRAGHYTCVYPAPGPINIVQPTKQTGISGCGQGHVAGFSPLRAVPRGVCV